MLTVQYLAGSEDLDHERQPMCDELLGVLLFLDAAELFEETLDQRSSVLMETRAQRLHPSVQSPRNPWEIITALNTHEVYEIHTLTCTEKIYMLQTQCDAVGDACTGSQELTQAPYVYADVHVAVFCTVVHGFFQGFQFGFPSSDLVNLRRTSPLQLRTLCQNLFQG